MSLQSLQVKDLLAKGEVRQVGTNGPIAIRLKYAGSGSVTSVTVTTATNIVLVTSDGGTETFAFSDYATVGALVDAIDSSNYWSAKVLDTVRSEATASQFVDGAITASTEDGNTYYDVKVDTDAANYLAVRLTYDRGFDKEVVKKSHRVNLQEIDYLVNLTTASANNLKVYEIDGTNETIRMEALPADNTATTINFAGGRGYITAGNGNDIVVKIDDDGQLVNADGNYLRVIGLIK